MTSMRTRHGKTTRKGFLSSYRAQFYRNNRVAAYRNIRKVMFTLGPISAALLLLVTLTISCL
jgi:hypothetical protein